MKKIVIIFTLLFGFLGFSQVTKSSISGVVKSEKGATIPGASVLVVHTPTGTKYSTSADFDGSFSVPSIRPGGPYTVKVTFMGYKAAEVNEINANLGSNVTVNVVLVDELSTLKEVIVKGKSGGSAFSKNRTGASQQFSTREITAVPTTGARTISSITKYNANAGSNGSFGGQDPRFNNFTIDGSVFNNGFGLGGSAQAGGRTGSSAISLDAIEQLQVNIAPFDVRQTGFTGSGINAVTRSGTNNVEGSVYASTRSNKPGFIGTRAGRVAITPQSFDEKTYGFRFGLPIIKDKLFFFGNYEQTESIAPGTVWTTSDSPLKGSQFSLPTTAEMKEVSDLLEKFGYTTGPWENFDAKSNSKKFLARLDWNINDNNKLNLRYVHHDSNSDEVISPASSIGFGSRTRNVNSMAFKNSGYVIKDNTRSIVLELDTKFSETFSNSFSAGYDYQNEDRALQGGGIFPLIDIKNGPNAFISAGLDPFTKDNRLDYSTLHFTNNMTKKAGSHTYVFGANFEKFVSNNSFYPGLSGAYVFNSLADFRDAANSSFTNGGAPATAGYASKFQLRYSALPGGETPLQILKSNKIDLYIQDEYRIDERLKLTYGLRASAIDFEDTAIENTVITPLKFRNNETFNTGDMPNTQYLFEPRFGFNLDVTGDTKTQVRGGTGIFTGRPPMVFLSNAIGNNGVLTGFDEVNGDDVKNGGYGFTPNPEEYFTPKTATLPTSFELALTKKNFQMPQSWKTNIAVDQKLPFGFVGTLEGIFSKNINEIFHYNANLPSPVGTLNGTTSGDNRPLYANTTNGIRINNNVTNAIVLSNTSKGYFYSTTVKLEYPYQKGLWGSIAYTRSDAYDLMSASSTASSSWSSGRSVNGNNNLPLSISNNNTPHRIVGLLGYKIEYGRKAGAATSISLGYIGETTNPFSYTYGGDINGDLDGFNDLLFVPKNASDLRFVDITQNVGGVTALLYSAADQAAAFDRYIDQDPYLSTRRGQYVERNSNVIPMLHKLDLGITQDFYIKIAGKKNSFQFRADILNFTNLLNKNWGVSQRATQTRILNVNQAPNSGNNFVPGFQLPFQFNENGTRELVKQTIQNQASTFDVWQAQFTLRYTFGK